MVDSKKLNKYQGYSIKRGFLHKDGKIFKKIILGNRSEYYKVGRNKFARLKYYNPDYHENFLKTKIGRFKIKTIKRPRAKLYK